MIQIGYNGDDWQIDSNGAGLTRILDLDGNNVARVPGGAFTTTHGALTVGGRNDDIALPLRVDRLGNILIGNANFLWSEQFEGTTVNTLKLLAANTTFAPTQTTAGGLNINPGNSVAANATSVYTSLKYFARYQRAPLQMKARARVAVVANSIAELGFGIPSGVVANIANGAFWRIPTSSAAQPFLAYSGGEVAGTTVDLTAYDLSFLVYDVIVDDDGAKFTIQDTSTGQLISRQSLSVPNTWAKGWAANRLPVFWRLYNAASVPATAPVMVISDVTVIAHDLDTGKTMGDIAGQNGWASDVTAGSVTQSANYANSAAPASGALSNTAAAYTNLGGQFQWVAIAGAETDYALFAYTVPAGFSLHVKGIRIELFNMGAANAATPTLCQFGVARNATTVNLSSGGGIRKTLGTIRIPASAAVGDRGDNVIDCVFDTPLVTEGGRLFTVILKIPVGAATASQIIRGTCHIDGRFE